MQVARLAGPQRGTEAQRGRLPCRSASRKAVELALNAAFPAPEPTLLSTRLFERIVLAVDKNHASVSYPT